MPQPLLSLAGSLLVLSAVLGAGYALTALRARRLDHHRQALRADIGLLQAALLPVVADTVGGVRASVAYRPSEGPAAGGDFYDALVLSDGRSAFIMGDVCGHGRQALARTAFVRYTLRAYLEAGMEPRAALKVGGAVIDEHMGGEFATVVLAVYDPVRGALTYSCAGHPPPIVTGPARPEPILAGAAPPVGLGLRTGLRQTVLPLAAGSMVCLYTDGLAEARTPRGVLGRPRLGDLVAGLGAGATAPAVLDRVSGEARIADDMATMVLGPTSGAAPGVVRVEQLEVDPGEVGEGLAERFLGACGLGPAGIRATLEQCRAALPRDGSVLLEVTYGPRGPEAQVVSGSGPTRTSIFPVF